MGFPESILHNKNTGVHLDHYRPLLNETVFLLTLERKPVLCVENKQTDKTSGKNPIRRLDLFGSRRVRLL